MLKVAHLLSDTQSPDSFPSQPTNTILIQEIACNQNIGVDIRGSHRGDSHTLLPQLQSSSWTCYRFPSWWSVTLHKHKSPSALVGLLCFSWISLVRTNAKSAWRLSKWAPYLRRVCVWYSVLSVRMCVVIFFKYVCVRVCVCGWVLSVCGYVCLFPPWDDVMSSRNQSHHLVVCENYWFTPHVVCGDTAFFILSFKMKYNILICSMKC